MSESVKHQATTPKGTVELSGLHLVRRVDHLHDDVINQKVGIQINQDGVAIAMKGLESGQSRPLFSSEPAVIDHYRRLDHEQYIIAVSQRPEVPEPIRIPLDRVPDGMRVCWLCEGAQMHEVEDGTFEDCAACKGEGVIPIGGLLSCDLDPLLFAHDQGDTLD